MELLNALSKYDEASANASALRQEAFEDDRAAAQSDHATQLARAVAEAGPRRGHDRGPRLPRRRPGGAGAQLGTLAVQVNGKLRGTIEAAVDAAREDIERSALAEPGVARFLEGMSVRKLIVVPGKIVNIVAGQG
jgi:leucyl-tRNA synthetase